MEIRTERIVVYGLSTRESERERERCVEETQENEKALKSEDLACVSKYFFDSRIGGGFPHFNFLHCLKAKISWHMFANAVHCTLHTHTHTGNSMDCKSLSTARWGSTFGA